MPLKKPVKSSFDSASLRDASLRMTGFWDGRESNLRSGVPGSPVRYRKVLFCSAFPSHGSPIVPAIRTASSPSVTKCDTYTAYRIPVTS
jgi:hypothetical protein